MLQVRGTTQYNSKYCLWKPSILMHDSSDPIRRAMQCIPYFIIHIVAHSFCLFSVRHLFYIISSSKPVYRSLGASSNEICMVIGNSAWRNKGNNTNNVYIGRHYPQNHKQPAVGGNELVTFFAVDGCRACYQPLGHASAIAVCILMHIAKDAYTTYELSSQLCAWL